MASYGWDAIQPKPRMPAVGQTVNSDPITVPRGAQTVTFHVPSLFNSATWKLQSLDPQIGATGTETWRDLQVFNLASGGVQLLGSVANGSLATTFPTAALGGGVVRMVASQDQSSQPVFISVTFNRIT